MFDLGWSELFIVGLATLLVVGPKELPTVLRTISKMMAKMRGMAREFQSSLDDMVRDTELDEIKKEFSAVKSELDVNARMNEMMSPDPDKDYWAMEDAVDKHNEKRMEELDAAEQRKAAVEAANKASAEYRPPSPSDAETEPAAADIEPSAEKTADAAKAS